MSTSCLTVRGRDLWLNDIDVSVLLAMVALKLPAANTSKWANGVRENWGVIKSSLSPGCISTGIEDFADDKNESLGVRHAVRSVLDAVRAQPDLLAPGTLNSIEIPGIRFVDVYPLSSLEKTVGDIVELLDDRA